MMASKTKASTICRTVYRDSKGRFTKELNQIASVDLAPIAQTPSTNPARLRARVVGKVEGQTARIKGDMAPGSVTRVAVFNPGIRQGKKEGGQTAEDARAAEKRLQRFVFKAAKEAKEANDFDWGREMRREQASRGGKTSAKKRAEVKAAQEKLTTATTSALLGMLQVKPKTLIEQRAVKAELKKRGIEPPKKKRGKK